MFELDVPGFKLLKLENIVLDFNGTISHDGKLISEVADRLFELKENFAIFVVTADTFGTVKAQMEKLARIKILETTNHRDEKRSFVTQLGKDSVVAFGNGRNDVMMLKAASPLVMSWAAGCQSDKVAASLLV